jgi:hypothetical protein
MHAVPIYNLRTWAVASSDAHGIVYRPTFRTFLLRLQWTFAAAVFMFLLWVITRSFFEPLVPPTLTAEQQAIATEGERTAREFLLEQAGPEDYERMLREAERERAVRDAAAMAQHERTERFRQIVVRVILGVMGILTFFGSLIPLSTLWARVTIERDVRGAILVRSRGLRIRRRRWMPDHFERIATWSMQRYRYSQHGSIRGHTWDWHVQLSPAGLPSMPYAGEAAISSKPMGPQFLLHRQKHQPGEKERAPEPVRTFVKALRALTNLPADPPKIIAGEIERGFFGPRVIRRAAHTSEIPITSTTQTYTSFDDIPPDVRERMAELLRSGEVTRHSDGTIEAVSYRVVRSDAPDGEELDANWNEIPPEIREQIERLRRNRG